MSDVESTKQGKQSQPNPTPYELMMLMLRGIDAPAPLLLPKGVLKPRRR